MVKPKEDWSQKARFASTKISLEGGRISLCKANLEWCVGGKTALVIDLTVDLVLNGT